MLHTMMSPTTQPFRLLRALSLASAGLALCSLLIGYSFFGNPVRGGREDYYTQNAKAAEEEARAAAAKSDEPANNSERLQWHAHANQESSAWAEVARLARRQADDAQLTATNLRLARAEHLQISIRVGTFFFCLSGLGWIILSYLLLKPHLAPTT